MHAITAGFNALHMLVGEDSCSLAASAHSRGHAGWAQQGGSLGCFHGVTE